MGARIADVVFIDYAPPSVTFRKADLVDVTFRGGNLLGAEFRGATLRHVHFRGTSLKSAVFGRNQYSDVTFTDVICPDGVNSDDKDGTCGEAGPSR